MDHVQMERMLGDLRRERTEAEHQLVALQRRVDALRKAADGMEDLLASDTEAPLEPSSPVVEPPRPADASAPREPHIEKPAGGRAALSVLKLNPDRFWTVREVWEEEVKQGWIAETKDARAAVRVALTRLYKSDAAVDRLDGPTSSYRWTADSRKTEA
jgi:hypothetical protein